MESLCGSAGPHKACRFCRTSTRWGVRQIVETFSIIAAIAAGAQALALVTLHLLPTGYNPVHDAVSDYGVGRYRALFWLQALAGAVAGFALAVALAETTPSIPSLVVVLLIVASAARLLVPFFATDQGASRFEPARGTIHTLLGHHPRQGRQPALDTVPRRLMFECRTEFGGGKDQRGEDQDRQAPRSALSSDYD